MSPLCCSSTHLTATHSLTCARPLWPFRASMAPPSKVLQMAQERRLEICALFRYVTILLTLIASTKFLRQEVTHTMLCGTLRAPLPGALCPREWLVFIVFFFFLPKMTKSCGCASTMTMQQVFSQDTVVGCIVLHLWDSLLRRLVLFGLSQISVHL